MPEHEEKIEKLRADLAQVDLLIEAHETLMAIEPENRERFGAVVAGLREDRARIARELAEAQGD